MLSCVFYYAVLWFLPLKCTSLITNEHIFLLTYTLMHCSFVIEVKSEILGISLRKRVILTFEENIENLTSDTSISYYILVFYSHWSSN